MSQQGTYTPPPKPTFDQYIQLSQDEINNHKNPVCVPLLARVGFYKTLFVLDKYFESYLSNPKTLYFLFHCHAKSLYSAIKDKLDAAENDGLNADQVNELQVNLERMKQFLQFMYKADVECERGSEIIARLQFEQNVDNLGSDDELMQFVFQNATVFDLERNKLKQVLLDVIQHYTVIHRSLNYRFDFEILLGFFRLIFERNGYIAPPRLDPGLAAQDALGEIDLFNELLSECGLTL